VKAGSGQFDHPNSGLWLLFFPAQAARPSAGSTAGSVKKERHALLVDDHVTLKKERHALLVDDHVT